MSYSLYTELSFLAFRSTGRYENCRPYGIPVAYPGILFGRGVQQIQLRTEARENWDLGAVAL